MPTAKEYLPVFLDMGDALLGSGAEIFRVEDTLNRMGYACGATQMNVFVITSSIVVTMEFPGDGARTQTRRIRENGGNDFSSTPPAPVFWLEKSQCLLIVENMCLTVIIILGSSRIFYYKVVTLEVRQML